MDMQNNIAQSLGRLEGVIQGLQVQLLDYKKAVDTSLEKTNEVSKELQVLKERLEPLFDNGQPGILTRMKSDIADIRKKTDSLEMMAKERVAMVKGVTWASKLWGKLILVALGSILSYVPKLLEWIAQYLAKGH